MILRPGGIDVYYIDESHDRHHFVASAIRIPFLRPIEGQWHIVWPDRLALAKKWRRDAKLKHKIPTSKELHGVKLASGRGNFLEGKHNFKRKQAAKAYQELLLNLHYFVPDSGIMSTCASRGTFLYGRDRLEAAMHALFQRMRLSCNENQTNAMVFFDQGHPEYRALYRMAQVYLATGSAYGSWGQDRTKNLPLDMFFKDGNEKDSKHCFFTQAVDLIAYSAFLKIKGEKGMLSDWQMELSSDKMYDSILPRLLNAKVSSTKDGIKRL